MTSFDLDFFKFGHAPYIFRKSLLWAVPVLALFGVSGAPRAADLSVDPVTIEAEAQAGEEFTGLIHVSLEADPDAKEKETVKKQLVVRVGDWDMKRDGSLVFAKADTLPWSCSKWVEVNPTNFELNVGDKVDVRYTLRLPKDLPNGTYRTIIFNQTQEVPLPGRRSVAISSAIATILYLTVGPHERKCRIVGFSADPKQAKISVENLGADHLRMTGTLKIEDESGKPVSEIKLPGSVTLPRFKPEDTRIRDITVEYPTDLKLAPGRYRVTAVIDYRGATLVGGRTTLVVPEPTKDSAETPSGAPADTPKKT